MCHNLWQVTKSISLFSIEKAVLKPVRKLKIRLLQGTAYTVFTISSKLMLQNTQNDKEKLMGQ